MPVPVREYVVARPRGRLGTIVREHHGYRERHVDPARHLGLPSPFLTLIFTLHEPLTISQQVDRSRPGGNYLTLVGGLHCRPAVIEHVGAQSGIQLQLSPLGARALFGLPAGELANCDLPAEDILGPLADELQDRLRVAATWPARFALLDRLLGDRIADAHSGVAAEVSQSWRMLVGSGGSVGIAEVAREVGWSERHLAKQFGVEIGMPPKRAARVIRFDRARRMIGSASGADVAARCGYFDQSHLVSDFTEFAGLSPRAFVAAEVGNLQVTDQLDVADSLI